MDVIINPKNLNEAFHFYISLPFYGIRDCLLKREIIFKCDEISSIHLDAKKTYVAAFSYSKNGFIGTLGLNGYSKKLYINNFPEKIIVERFINSKDVYKFAFSLLFNKYSPPMWHLGMSILMTCSFYFFHKLGIFKSNVVESIYCDQKCLIESYNYFLSFIMTVSTSLLGIVICWYLAFIQTKKIHNSDLYNSIKSSAILMIIVNLLICSKAATRVQDPRFHTVVKLITDSNLNHEKNKREIASAKEFLIEVKNHKKR